MSEKSNAVPTKCYGLFWKRSSGQPSACKLINDEVFWNIDDAVLALSQMDSPRCLEIRSMFLTVGNIVAHECSSSV